MDDKKLAEIFYVMVHDFSETLLKEGIAQKKVNETTYRVIIANIYDWAHENEYQAIERHAYKLLHRLNAAGV